MNNSLIGRCYKALFYLFTPPRHKDSSSVLQQHLINMFFISKMTIRLGLGEKWEIFYQFFHHEELFFYTFLTVLSIVDQRDQRFVLCFEAINYTNLWLLNNEDKLLVHETQVTLFWIK